jgi:hypothetical protein
LAIKCLKNPIKRTHDLEVLLLRSKIAFWFSDFFFGKSKVTILKKESKNFPFEWNSRFQDFRWYCTIQVRLNAYFLGEPSYAPNLPMKIRQMILQII